MLYLLFSHFIVHIHTINTCTLELVSLDSPCSNCSNTLHTVVDNMIILWTQTVHFSISIKKNICKYII